MDHHSFNQDAREEKPVTKTRSRYATEEAYLRARESQRRYGQRRGAKLSRQRRIRRDRREAAKLVERQRENEFGGIVTKLNIKVGMSREAIYELLGGLVTMTEINQWCDKAKKKASKLKAKKTSTNGNAANS